MGPSRGQRAGASTKINPSNLFLFNRKYLKMFIVVTIWKVFVGINNNKSWNDWPVIRNRIGARELGCAVRDSTLYITFKTKMISWNQSIDCSIKTSKINTTTIMVSLFLSICLIMRRPIPRGQLSSIWCALNATCSANLCKYLPNIIVDVSPNIDINSNKCSFCRSHEIFSYISIEPLIHICAPQINANIS